MPWSTNTLLASDGAALRVMSAVGADVTSRLEGRSVVEAAWLFAFTSAAAP
jgi:hypothetical protein